MFSTSSFASLQMEQLMETLGNVWDWYGQGGKEEEISRRSAAASASTRHGPTSTPGCPSSGPGCGARLAASAVPGLEMRRERERSSTLQNPVGPTDDDGTWGPASVLENRVYQ